MTGVEVERTRLDGSRAVGTGETYVVPADLVVICIGYQTSPIAGVPFEESAGRFANVDGRILPGLYCVGWARRGPSGTIGTNKPDGFSIIGVIAEDIDQALRAARARQAARASMLWQRRAGSMSSASATGRRSRKPRMRGRGTVPAREIRAGGGDDRGGGEGVKAPAPVKPASASAHRAPGSCHPGGSASARRHRRGAVRLCRLRSGRGCP